MEIPRGFQPGAVPRKAAAVADAISPTQRALSKTVSERSAARDLMGAGAIVQQEIDQVTEKHRRERERAENAEDVNNITMEAHRIFSAREAAMDQPGYRPEDDEDDQITAELTELAGTARNPAAQQAARSYLQQQQIRYMDRREKTLRDRARSDALDATREGAEYALSTGNWELAENAARMNRDLGGTVEYSEGIKRRADVGRGMEEFNAVWDETATFEENLAEATAFVDRYSSRANVNPQNRDAAVRAMRTELGIREKANRSQIAADEQFSQAEALDNYRKTQRAINTGEPYTEDQVNLMFEVGAFGPTDSTAAVSYKNNLLDSLNTVDRTSQDLYNILSQNYAAAPAVNTERTSQASQLAYNNALNSGMDERMAASEAARQTGRVPRQVEQQVERGWRSATADNVQPFGESLLNYANVQDNSPPAYWSLDRDTQTAMNFGYTMLKGLTPEEQQAQANVVARRVFDLMNVDEATRDSRRQQWNSTHHRTAAQELTKRARETEELSVPSWWGFARNVPAKMPLQMREYFAESAKLAYMSTGDVEGAWEQAVRDTQQTWVATNINEDVEGLDGEDIGEQWQWQGIPSRYAAQYRGAMGRDVLNQTFMLKDGTEHTIKGDDVNDIAIEPFEPPVYNEDGQQVYQLQYKGLPMMGEFGPIRWYPEFD